MQFIDNKKNKNNNDKNFLFSGTLKMCSISIGSEVKDKYSQSEHPIKRAIREAEKFVYIISPYIGYPEDEAIKKPIKDILIKKAKENENIKIKLICSYTANRYRNYEIDKSYLRVFNSLIKKVTGKNLKEKEIEIDNEIAKKKPFLSNFLIGTIILLIFSSISLGFLFHFNKLSKNYFNSLGLAFLLSIIGILISLIKIINLEKNKQKQLDIYKSTTPPSVEWYKNINFKITKNYYNTGREDLSLIHTKLYIMDCPNLTKSLRETKQLKENEIAIIAFLGSVNFGNSAFYKNNEFLLKTSDTDFTKELKNYFENFYESIPKDSILTKEEIVNVLFNKGFISYNGIKI